MCWVFGFLQQKSIRGALKGSIGVSLKGSRGFLLGFKFKGLAFRGLGFRVQGFSVLGLL